MTTSSTKKKQVHITVDEDVWEHARNLIPNISQEVNEYLKDKVNLFSEEDILQREMNHHKAKYNSAKKQYETYQKNKEFKQSNMDDLDKVLSWAEDVYIRKGKIGLNQLKNVCNNRDVSFDDAKRVLGDKGYELVNYQ